MMEPPPAPLQPGAPPQPPILPSPPSPELLGRVDDDVKEYLLYRGFTGTINAFEAERRDDRLKAFDVEKVLAQIDAFVRTYDVGALLRFWEFLDRRLFAHLDAHHAREMHKMKVALLRYYVVYCVKTERRDKAIEFLAEHTLSHGPSTPSSSAGAGAGAGGGVRGPSPSGIPPQLQAETDAAWRQWFVLPHLRDPTRDGQFSVFFSSSWADTLRVSLRNVLTVILHAVPPPKLISLRAQEKGTQALRAELARARQETGDAALRARALEGHCLALTGAVEALQGCVAAAAGNDDNDKRSETTALREAVAQVRAALADPYPLSQPQQQQCGQKGVGVGSGSANMLDEAVAALTQRVAAWAGVGDDGKEGAAGGSQPQEEQEEGEQVEAVGSGDR